jgi:hypothetical protein
MSPSGHHRASMVEPEVSFLDAVAPREELVATPSGLYHRSCVNEIPSGAFQDLDGTITLKNGERFTKKDCLFPGRRTTDGLKLQPKSPISFGFQLPTNTGWMAYAFDNLTGGNAYGELSADWEVPDDPVGSYSGSVGPYYAFPGIQSSTYILQPVLQYGNNGHFGGSYWRLASWSCDSGTDCNYSTPISASEGDEILGSIAASACENDVCTWTIVSRNVTTQTQTTRIFVDTWNYYWATGGAVEVYDITTCSQYPEDGVYFTDISMEDKYGSPVTPSWTHYIRSDPDPDCYFDVESTSSSVGVLHNPPPLLVDIDGPTYITSSGTYQWEADVSGGRGNYTYQWYHRTNHSTPTCTYQTSWTSGGTADSTSFYIQVPGYVQQIRLEVMSGLQESVDNQFIGLSRYRECPEKASGGM